MLSSESSRTFLVIGPVAAAVLAASSASRSFKRAISLTIIVAGVLDLMQKLEFMPFGSGSRQSVSNDVRIAKTLGQVSCCVRCVSELRQNVVGLDTGQGKSLRVRDRFARLRFGFLVPGEQFPISPGQVCMSRFKILLIVHHGVRRNSKH